MEELTRAEKRVKQLYVTYPWLKDSDKALIWYFWFYEGQLKSRDSISYQEWMIASPPDSTIRRAGRSMRAKMGLKRSKHAQMRIEGRRKQYQNYYSKWRH